MARRNMERLDAQWSARIDHCNGSSLAFHPSAHSYLHMRRSDVMRDDLACRCIGHIVSTEIESSHFSVQFLRVFRLKFVQFIFETTVSQSTENDVGSLDGRPIADEILIGIHTFQCHVGDA